MNTLVIGFGFKARRGKDTAARAIIAAKGGQYDIRRYAFADALKKEANAAAEAAGSMHDLITQMRITHNLPLWVQYEFNADMSDPLCPMGKQRSLLQWWGTEYRRNSDPFYWVKQLDAQIKQDNPQVALVTDVRFPNEFMWVKSVEGYTVKLERNGFVDQLTADSKAHASENALSSFIFDYEIIVADGDVDELEKDAVRLFDIIVDSLNPPDTDFTVEVEHEAQPTVVPA